MKLDKKLYFELPEQSQKDSPLFLNLTQVLVIDGILILLIPVLKAYYVHLKMGCS